MNLLIVSADYSKWMYKSLFDEQQSLFKYLKKKKHNLYIFGPGQKDCSELDLNLFLKKKRINLNQIKGIIFFVPERGFYDGISKYEMNYFSTNNRYYLSQFKKFDKIPKILFLNDFWHNNKYDWELCIKQYKITDIFSMYVPFHTAKKNFNKYFLFKGKPTFHKLYRSINLNNLSSDNISKNKKRDKDVTLLGAVGNFYPFRKKSIQIIKSDKSINFFYKKHPGYLFQKDIKEKKIVGKEYYKILEDSKIAITCSTIYKIPIPKIWEIMSTGAMLMVDKMDNIKITGLKKGINFVEVNEKNLLKKIHYYLNNPIKRNRIAFNGMSYARSKFNTSLQAKKIGNKIIQIFTNRKLKNFQSKLNYNNFEVFQLKLSSKINTINIIIFKILRKILTLI